MSAAPIVLFSRVVPPSASASGPPSPAVTGIPFSYPAAANSHVDQIVRQYRLDYLVLCNTAVTTADRVGKPINTEDAMSYAARYSSINAAAGNLICSAASFTPYTDGRSGGDCTLSGSDPVARQQAIPTLSHSSHIYIAFLVHSFTINSVLHFSFHITHVRDSKYADKPGAVAIVPTGISSNGNECAAFENGGNSVDTSALLVSITPAGTIPVKTPGLITSTGDGGVFETYIAANSTYGSGNIHWSWRSVSASSNSWWAIYGTSWTCTRTVEQAIMQQPPTRVPVTLTSALITTIINGVTTTNISGSSS
jgi:hypothetical protein